MFFQRKLWTVPLSLIFLYACSCSLPREENRFTVMSWNVQNLFDAVDDGNEYPEFDPGSEAWNERLYLRRLERTADVILSSDIGVPDLVVLQELESTNVLDDLAAGPLAGKGYRWHLAVPGFSIIRCGILSRYPLYDVQVIDCGYYGTRPLRPAVLFTVDTPSGLLRVAAAHWKSPRDGRAATEKSRCREAGILKSVLLPLLQRTPKAQVLIIGDLNTPGDGQVVPAALSPWNPGIDMASEKSVLYRTEFPEGTGVREGQLVFFDPEPDPGRGSPGTFWYHDEWERPDRALLSRGLVNAPGLVFDSCRTVPELAGDNSGRPVRWISSREEGYSDHLPLLLEFFIEPAEEDTESE